MLSQPISTSAAYTATVTQSTRPSARLFSLSLLLIVRIGDLHVLDVIDQRRPRDRVGQIEFREQAGDRRGDRRAEAAVLDIDRDGDFRVVAGREAEKGAVIRSVRVLRRSGLAADVEARHHRDAPRAAFVDGLVHALDDRVEVARVDFRVMVLVETRVDRIPVVDATCGIR